MSSKPKPTSLADHVEALRADLKKADFHQLASLTGASYQFTEGEHGLFKLPMWGKKVAVATQDFVARDLRTQQPLDLLSQALIAYYFHNTKFYVYKEGWISFTEIPGAKFYNPAHKEQTAKKLLNFFGNDYQAFEEAAKKSGGKLTPFDTIAYKFQVFPKVALLVTLWKGDVDFPPSYRILFNRESVYHLNAEAFAILSGVLATRIINAK